MTIPFVSNRSCVCQTFSSKVLQLKRSLCAFSPVRMILRFQMSLKITNPTEK